MKKIIKDHFDFLMFLKSINKKSLKNLINYLNDESIEKICGLCFNVLYNKKLFKNKNDLKRLKKHLTKYKKIITSLSKKNNKIETKRKILINQSGQGLISSLIATVLPLISSLFIK